MCIRTALTVSSSQTFICPWYCHCCRSERCCLDWSHCVCPWYCHLCRSHHCQRLLVLTVHSSIRNALQDHCCGESVIIRAINANGRQSQSVAEVADSWQHEPASE